MRFLFVSLIILFASCTTNVVGVRKGDNIDNEERQTIRKKAVIIYNCIESKNEEGFKKELSAFLNGREFPLKQFVNINVQHGLSSFSVVSEYEVLNPHNAQVINQVPGSLGNYQFTYQFRPISDKTFVYLFTVPDSVGNEWLISTVWNYENKDWKITACNSAYISCKGKIAPYCYEKANTYRLAKRIVPASYYALLAMQLLKPAGEAFHYTTENGIADLCKEILDSANVFKPLPTIVTEIKSQPIIVQFGPYAHDLNVYPTITYHSSYPLSDKLMITKENEQLHQRIDKLFPYIYDIGDTILYRVTAGSTNDFFEILKSRIK